MKFPEIRIPRKLANQLLHLAQQSPDVEICGLVSSKNGLPNRCYAIDNIASHPSKQFLLNSSQQIAALTDMRERGETLFAIYHSHPSAPATPSITDLKLISYPDAIYLIISLNTKGILEMRGFCLQQQTAQEVTLVLSEN